MGAWGECGKLGQEVRWEPGTENVMSHNEGLNVTDFEWEATGDKGGRTGKTRFAFWPDDCTIRREVREWKDRRLKPPGRSIQQSPNDSGWGLLQNQEEFCE